MRLPTIVAAAILTGGLGLTALTPPADAAIASAYGYPISHYLSDEGLPAGVTPRQPRVLLLGDSTMASLAWNPPSQVTLDRLQPNVTLDARSCRTISIPSCVGRTDPITGIRSAAPNALEVLGATASGSYDEVVMMIGYDEGWAAFQNSVPAFLQLARQKGISHVTWLTFHSNGNYAPPSGMGDASYRSNNILLQQNADASNGFLTLLDWASYADEPGHAGWLQPDGAHLTSDGSFALGDFITDAVLDTWQTVLSSPAAALGHAQLPAGPAGGFTFLPDPVRVLDTRDGTGLAHSGIVAAGQSLRVQLPATAGLIGATVNVTVIDPSTNGFITVYPCTSTVPVASNSNFLAGEARAATATVAVDTTGGFCIYSSSWTRLAVDEMAVVTARSSGVVTPSAIAPVRVLDTRSSFNGGRLRANTPQEVPLAGFHLTGSAMSVNATLVATAEDYVTVYPTEANGQCAWPPGTSTVNSSKPVAAVPNRVDVPVLTATPKVCVFSPIDTDLVLDITATFAAGSTYRTASPTRLVDTRSGLGGTRGTQWRVTVPKGQIASLVVTSVGSGANSYLTVYPSNASQQCGPAPTVSTVNVAAGSARANSTFAAASTGTVCISSSAVTDLVVDLQGGTTG